MNITKEQIQEQIGKLHIEQAVLQTNHDNMVKSFQEKQIEFQQIVQGNQNRFQQITGAIAQLTDLMKSFDPPLPSA